MYPFVPWPWRTMLAAAHVRGIEMRPACLHSHCTARSSSPQVPKPTSGKRPVSPLPSLNLRLRSASSEGSMAPVSLQM